MTKRSQLKNEIDPQFEIVDAAGKLLFGQRYGVRLAQRLEISQPILSQYKTGDRRMPIAILHKLADVCAAAAEEKRIEADKLLDIAVSAKAIAIID